MTAWVRPKRLCAKTADDERRLERYERQMALPIFLAAVLPILFSLAGRESIVSNTVLIVAWVVFIVDLVVHVRLIPRFLHSGLGIFDLSVVVLTAPWFLIPGLGDARFLALAGWPVSARAQGRGRILQTARRVTRPCRNRHRWVIITCGYVTYSAERSVNPEFGSFGDAMWWATVTITTVGYGDITPITTAGRITAVVLMFSGLALLGVLAGALASFFGFAQQTASADASAEPMVDDVDGRATDMRLRLADLRTRIAALDSAVAEMEDPST